MRPRFTLPGMYYFLTRRCAMRQFLLKADKQTITLFLYALANAAAASGVKVIGFVVMSNHYHIIVFDPHGRIADFTHHLNTHLARSFNKYWQRGEAMFTPGGLSQVQLLTRADVIDKLAYTLVNPVAAGLVGKASAWEGPSSWAAMKHNTAFHIPRPNLLYRKCRPRFGDLTLHLGNDDLLGDRATLVAEVMAQVRIRELAFEQARQKADQTVLGMDRVRAQSHEATPARRHQMFGLRPHIASRSAWHRIQALQRNKQFCAAHATARARLNADQQPHFPLGTTAMWHLIDPPFRYSKPPKVDLNQRDASGALVFH
jgi:putative transposase